MSNLHRKFFATSIFSCQCWWGAIVVWHRNHMLWTMKQKGLLLARSLSPGLKDPLAQSRRLIPAHPRSLYVCFIMRQWPTIKLEHLGAMSRHGDPCLSSKGKEMAVNILSYVFPGPSEVRGILFCSNMREISYPAVRHVCLTWFCSLDGLHERSVGDSSAGIRPCAPA